VSKATVPLISSTGARTRRSGRLGDKLWLLCIQLLVLVGAVITFLPVVWMISGSFKLEKDIFTSPPQWIPNPWTWNNYVEAWHALPFGRFTFNTLVVVFFTLIGAFFSNTLVAFGFARLRARGRNFLFLLCLATLMLPQHVTLIPVYVLFSKLGWIDSYLPLIVPAFLASPFWVFMLRQFFMTIPLELDEAARMDGASTLHIYWQIMLPLSRPALTTLVIFVFLETWREFFLPLIYLNSQEKFTLAIGLNLLKGTADYNARYDLLMAVATVMALPPLLLFFFGQKYFVQGLAMTGLKG
jgi:ABC-type glycerol-3-phosphate transport system permease component